MSTVVARRTAGCRDRGSAVLEFVLAIPVLIVVMLAVLQTVALLSATSATNQAARDGARAYSLGRGVDAAVRASLPNGLEPRRISTGPDGTVAVTVDARRIAPFMPTLSVTRTVAMP